MKRILFLLTIVTYLAFTTTSCRNPKNKDAAQTHEHGETTHVHDGTEHTHDSVPAGQVEFTITDSLAAKDSAEKAHEHAHEHGHDHQH